MIDDPRSRPPHDGMTTKAPHKTPRPAGASAPEPNQDTNQEAQDAEFYRRQHIAHVGSTLEQGMREIGAKLGVQYRIAVLCFEIALKEDGGDTGSGRAGTVAGMQFAADVSSKAEFVSLLQLAAKVETEQLARAQGQKILRPGDREWPGALRTR